MCVCFSFEFMFICLRFYDLRCLLNIDKRNTLQIFGLAEGPKGQGPSPHNSING